MTLLSLLLLIAAAVMIPFGLASDQGEGLIIAAIACAAVAVVLFIIGLRQRGTSRPAAWSPADDRAVRSAVEEARTEAAPTAAPVIDTAPAASRAPTRRAPAKRTVKKKATARKAPAKKATTAKKAVKKTAKRATKRA